MMKAQHASSFMRRPGRGAVSAAALALGLLAAPRWRQRPARLVTISHPWMRFLTARIPAAGYFTLSNGSAQPATLTAAASPDCGQLMLHRSVSENGTARMEMVPNVVVPPPWHGDVQPRRLSPDVHVPGGGDRSQVGACRCRPALLDDGTSLSAKFPVYGAKGP